MKGWKEVNIGDLGEVITGNTPLTSDREYYGGVYPFIKPTDMEIDRRRVANWAENYSEKAFKKFKKAYIPKGSTGVVTIGTVGEKIFQADKNCFTNQSVNVVVPNKEIYDEDFIFYLLKFNLPKVSSANPGTASGRHHVSKSNFCSIKILVPDTKTVQQRIGKILSAYDDLIENNFRRIKLLEETAQITFNEWFVKFKVNDEELKKKNGLPVDWEKKKISDICKATGGGTPSKAISKYWEGGTITWFSPTDLSKSNCIFQIDSANKITEAGLKSSSAKLLQPDSFMFSSRATIGLFGIVDKPFCTNQGFICVTPQKKFHKEFLFYNFLSRIEEFKGHATGSTFPELTKTKFNALEIIFPDDRTLMKFHELIKPIHELIGNLTHQNRLLKEARNILLPRLMTGVIEVKAEETKVVAIAVTDFPRMVSGITATDLQAGIISMVIDLHQKNPKYTANLSHVKCEKISDLTERKLGISLGRVAVKDAAGPDDFPHLQKVEHRANKAGYFRNVALPVGHTYKPLQNMQKAIDKVRTVLTATELNAIEKMLQEFLPFGLEHSELVATIYAGWNNLFLSGKQPTDEEIVFESRENWSQRKLGIPREKFFKTLEWMKRHDYIPEGKGQMVLKKEEVEVKRKSTRKSKKEKVKM